jgi:hypothetical protein
MSPIQPVQSVTLNPFAQQHDSDPVTAGEAEEDQGKLLDDRL